MQNNGCMKKHRDKNSSYLQTTQGRGTSEVFLIWSQIVCSRNKAKQWKIFSHALIFTSGHIANYYRLEKADPSFTYPLNCNTFKQTMLNLGMISLERLATATCLCTYRQSETSTGNICLNLAIIQAQIMRLYLGRQVCQGQCCDHRRLLSLGFPSWSLRAAKHKFEIINQCIISSSIWWS